MRTWPQSSAVFAAALSVVSGCAAPQSADSAAAQQPEYVAQFNEPFLQFASDGEFLTVTSPEDLDGTRVPVFRDDANGAALFQVKVDGRSFTLGIERGDCFDDMSGLPFSHNATLAGMSEGRDLAGCARLTTEPQPREQ